MSRHVARSADPIEQKQGCVRPPQETEGQPICWRPRNVVAGRIQQRQGQPNHARNHTMSLTALTLIAKDAVTGEQTPFNFNPLLNKKGGTTKFIAPLLHAADGSDGSGSAKDLRLMFKAQGVKGRELTDAVNKALRDGKTVRQARTQLFLAAAIEDGFVTSHIEMNAKRDEFRIIGRKAAERPDAATKKLSKTESALAAQKAENERLAKELADLKAMVAGLLPAGSSSAPAAAPAPSESASLTDEELARRPIAPVPACA